VRRLDSVRRHACGIALVADIEVGTLPVGTSREDFVQEVWNAEAVFTRGRTSLRFAKLWADRASTCTWTPTSHHWPMIRSSALSFGRRVELRHSQCLCLPAPCRPARLHASTTKEVLGRAAEAEPAGQR